MRLEGAVNVRQTRPTGPSAHQPRVVWEVGSRLRVQVLGEALADPKALARHQPRRPRVVQRKNRVVRVGQANRVRLGAVTTGSLAGLLHTNRGSAL